MNEELEPLGLPSPPAGDQPRTLAELIGQNPLVALAAAAAAGAGVMALVVASQRRDDTGHLRINTQATHVYDELRNQLGKLAERVNASLPTKEVVEKTASHLGDEASKMIESTVDAAKRSFGGTTAAGKHVAQTALAHPLLTTLVLGSLGALAASLVPHAETSSTEAPPQPT